jgi:DNA end-binding protein Ku
MARAMWKATLRLGEVELPVKLYAGVEDRGVHFRLLHAADGVPVRQRMVDPRDGEEVPPDAIRRGVEVEKGRFVVLRPEELAGLEPEPSRTIEVLRVVPPEAIDLSWYVRPYFLGPDGAEPEYFALAAALRDAGRCGVARWVMRGGRHLGVLAARGPHLALVTLRSASEVVAAGELARPEAPAIRAAERSLANQLVAALEGSFDPEELRDEHRERVLAFVEAKARGGRYAVEEAPPPAPTADLASALERSLAAARRARRAAS